MQEKKERLFENTCSKIIKEKKFCDYNQKKLLI